MNKILLVANVSKEHVLKFHVPTIKMAKEMGWQIDVACAGEEKVPYCDNQFVMSYKRSPFNFALFKGIKELKNIVEKGNYDIVYCHTPVGGLAARIASRRARKKGTKVIYFAHGYHFFEGAPKLNWIIYYTMEKFLSLMTDSIILINQEDYDLTVNKFTNCRPYILDGIGVDTSRFQVENKEEVRKQYRQEMNIPEDATVLVYLAELLANKNQTFLMRALKRVLKQDENVYLVLAGMDHSKGKFGAYAKQLGIKDHIRFLGWRSDVGELYNMADICTASSIREGFGLNLVEAMSCDVPVIASKNRGHATIIRDGENGYLVDLGDEEAFANRILELAHDPEKRKQFAEVGSREKDKFSSETILKNIKIILEEHL